MILFSIISFGVATGLRLVSACGCHLHERGRGWPPLCFRGADDLQPILVTCMSRGNETRIWSGHHLQNDLCLARQRNAPRLCTLTSRRRWSYVPEPLGYLSWRGCMTAPRFSTWLPPSREVAAGHLPIDRILCYIFDWSGHHLQSHLSLARLRSAPCLCTRMSPRRWAAWAGAGMSFWSIRFLGVAT